MPIFLAGCAVSCGALLVLAGSSKVYRAARRMDGHSAIWRALRVPRRLVSTAELAVGGLECLTGATVCARIYPVAAGAAMALLGAAFCVLLGYVRVKRVPGGCGCVSWRRPAGTGHPAGGRAATAQTATWRVVARAGMLSVAGIADALAPGGTIAYRQAWFYAGGLTAALVLTLLTTHVLVRTPVCHRPLWRPARALLRALTGHEVFEAMASAAGPFGSDVRHRRAGCADEFCFPVAGYDDGRSVVFYMSYGAPGGSLTIHASVRGNLAPDFAVRDPNNRASLTVFR
jgi:hypothetical protein